MFLKVLQAIKSKLHPYDTYSTPEKEQLRDSIWRENISRLKIIGVLGALVNLMILSVYVRTGGFEQLTTPESLSRILWILAGLGYIFIVGKTPTDFKVKRHQNVIFVFAATLSLMFSALITGMSTYDTSYTFLYIINILLTGTFLHFSMAGFFLIACPSLSYLIYIIMTDTQSMLHANENWINIVAVSLFAMAISHTNLTAKLSQFHSMNIIEEQNQSLLKLTESDGLTGIGNRRKIDRFLQTEFNRPMKAGLPTSVMMIDIDYFKNYNDTYGHQMGDDCLREIAAIIQSHVYKQTDLVGRYGGEEFLVMMTGTDTTKAHHMAEIILNAISNRRIPHTGAPLEYVTVSIGIAGLPDDTATSMDDLINHADQAMYHAKNQGRNRVCAYDGSEVIRSTCCKAVLC